MKKKEETNKVDKELSYRLSQIRRFLCNDSNGVFADRLKKNKTYVSQICNGSKSVGKKILEEILAAFPEVSRTWLMVGEGEMCIEQGKTGGGNLLTKETKDHLLENYLSHYPDANHPYDYKRFLLYAIKCIEDECYMDYDTIRNKVSATTLKRLEIAYIWIELTYHYMLEEYSMGADSERINELKGYNDLLREKVANLEAELQRERE
ncbi:MAG: hypothetical protein IJR13_07730 [Bacteroidales bacterium]|nr:hypothetical protein [Bacteroidales bacterium]